MYSMLRNKLTQQEVSKIVGEAVEHEKEFITTALPCNLVGMNNKLMSTYIEYIADRLMLQLGTAQYSMRKIRLISWKPSL